jgi:hypothetical protein
MPCEGPPHNQFGFYAAGFRSLVIDTRRKDKQAIIQSVKVSNRISNCRERVYDAATFAAFAHPPGSPTRCWAELRSCLIERERLLQKANKRRPECT